MDKVCCPDMERELGTKEFLDIDPDDEPSVPYLLAGGDGIMTGAQFINYCPFCGARVSPRLPLRYSDTHRNNHDH